MFLDFRLFEKSRVQLYFHGGKLLKDKKTDQRRWRINLVVTLNAHDMLSCDEVLLSAYQTISAGENQVEEMKLALVPPNQNISFFGLADHQAPLLMLGRCDVTELKMTRMEGMVELWLKAEHPCTDTLHAFVKDYSFSRFWAEFSPSQAPLTMPAAAQPAKEEVVRTDPKRVN